MKKLIKRVLKTSGFEVRKYIPGSSTNAQIAVGLKHFGIDLVMDVGANIGQFGEDLREGGFGGRIISYEPLPDAYAQLVQNAAHDPMWDVHHRSAIGAFNGEISINVAQNSASSSILPMLDRHLEAAPYSVYVNKINVPIKRLDDSLNQRFYSSNAPFLKIDTQGYEWDVLDGAPNVLEKCRGILLELSFVPLYDGQHLWAEIVERLSCLGFSVWALQPGFTDLKNGQMLQADGIFFRV